MKPLIIHSRQTKKVLSTLHLGQRWLLIGSSMLILSACASQAKAPSAELAAAEQAIGMAERAQVTRYTTTELDTARQELVAARSAITAENMPQAQRLAVQAQLSAELALARAELMKAQEINKDMQQSIEAIKQEAQRNQQGVRP